MRRSMEVFALVFLCTLTQVIWCIQARILVHELSQQQEFDWHSAVQFCEQKNQRLATDSSFRGNETELKQLGQEFWWLNSRCSWKDMDGKELDLTDEELSHHVGPSSKGSCLCLLCWSKRRCRLANCDCNSQLSYTWPDLLERDRRRDVATNTKYKYNSFPHRISHTEQLYSYYSRDIVTWSEALNRNQDNEVYTNSSAIINMIKDGIYLATETVYDYEKAIYKDSYWIGLGNYTCSSAEGMELSPLRNHGTCFSYSAGSYPGLNCTSSKQTSYMACESDTTESERRGSCEFPFEHDGIWYSTCITREDSQLRCKGRESEDKWYVCPGNTNDSTTTSSGAPEISAGSSTPPVKPSAGNVSISVVNTTDAMTSTANQRLGKSTWPSNQTIATDSFEEKATLPNKAVGNTNDSTTTSSGAPEISAGSSTPPVKPSAGSVSISVVNTAGAMTITANQGLGNSTWPSTQTTAPDYLEEKATLPNNGAGKSRIAVYVGASVGGVALIVLLIISILVYRSRGERHMPAEKPGQDGRSKNSADPELKSGHEPKQLPHTTINGDLYAVVTKLRSNPETNRQTGSCKASADSQPFTSPSVSTSQVDSESDESSDGLVMVDNDLYSVNAG